MEVPTHQYDMKTAPDMLQLNMEIISKELNDLIVTGEKEFGMTQKCSYVSVTNLQTTTPKQLPLQQENIKDSAYLINSMYGQQQLQNISGLHNMKPNLNYYQNLPMAQLPFGRNNIISHNVSLPCYTPINYLFNGQNLSHSTLGSSQASINVTGCPTYEFHYLKSPGENEKKSPRNNTTMSNGAYRKTPKSVNKQLGQKFQSQIQSSEYDRIKVDLSFLEFSKEGHNKNEVQYLFNLLRDLHHAVAEMPPTLETCSDSQYEETFAPVLSTKCTMSMTLNVQNQVKHACRKLAIFICEMQRLLNANKSYDRNMYAECEYYLNTLRQLVTQFEMYKRIEMEHKRGQFLREEVKVHAERLSLLLENINRQIREVRIRIVAFDWYMGVKYRGDACIAAKAVSNNNEDKGVSKKTKMGVINEILQLCNTTVTTATVIATTTTAAAAAANSKTNIAITSTKTTTKPDLSIYSGMNANYNEELGNAKSILNKNNDIFNVFLPDQTKMTTVANTNGNSNNVRHPVFYIG